MYSYNTQVKKNLIEEEKLYTKLTISVYAGIK